MTPFFFLTQLMSIPEIYLPNLVEIYNFFYIIFFLYYIFLYLFPKLFLKNLDTQVMRTLMLLAFCMVILLHFYFIEPWSFYPKSLEIICPKCIQTSLQVLDYLMKICLPNPEGSEIFFYPTFYALEFLFTQPFSLRPQPRQ